MKAFEEQLKNNGFAIIRGFLSPTETAAISAEADRLYAEGLKHHASYRDHNLLFEILDDPKARRRVVLQAHWTAWISPLMEEMRRSSKYFEVLQPFLGNDIRQMSHQIHWKPPGAKYTFYRFHQDARFRSGNLTEHEYLNSTVTTGLAIDRQTVENGALRVFPGSHRLGYLGLSDDGPIMVGQTQDEELRRAGLDPSAAVVCEMDPGDLLLWNLFTVHGSAPNVSNYDRRFMINSYVRAADSEHGEWAFRNGVSTPLGLQPEICKYEQLRERPGPFYIESDWTEEARK